MKRLLVAATAAVIAAPTLTAVPAQAQPVPAPSHVLTTTSASSRPTATSLAAARASVVNHANRYSRQARHVGWRTKDRNARHLAQLTKRARLSPAKRALYISYTQRGTPYRWGGTTARGFDCSGYTGYVYKKAGKTLPRTARAQYRATKRTSRPVPGDLVFFGGRNAYHVGIYVGRGRMIHSPRAGKPVQIAKIWRGASYGKVR